MPSLKDTLLIVAVIALAWAVFMLVNQPPKGNWVTADGVKIWPLPKEAVLVERNAAFEKRVRELYESGRLIVFTGQAISGGIDKVRAREKAKINAYKELAEYFETRLQTFAQLVEGQIQAIKDKDRVTSVAVNAYKRVTELFSEAKVSGAYVYAVWEEMVGSLVYTTVLLVFDPVGAVEAAKQTVMADQEISKAIEELGKNGVDFFKMLNEVISEAKK
ncbi:hypothetical protein [Fervidobacterium thailandense]|uniref:hypothetical protein n=1 Tax=Fervidobacterium thailandense TaxID=1008305 RepID=UPI000A90A699|nr:hypothetical protein [Fervidobacterium thailandense]